VAPALLVLEAEVILKSSKGTRQVTLESIFTGKGHPHLNLEAGEIITEIVIPRRPAGEFSCYKKIANRESIDFPIVGAAFWTSADRKESRIAFTAVDRQPIRAGKAEGHLNQNGLNTESLDSASELAAKEGRPTKSSHYSPSFKKTMMGRLLKAAVREALEG
jgi:CO/xanthine dehydrogenase FAD-binding subunit